MGCKNETTITLNDVNNAVNKKKIGLCPRSKATVYEGSFNAPIAGGVVPGCKVSVTVRSRQVAFLSIVSPPEKTSE